MALRGKGGDDVLCLRCVCVRRGHCGARESKRRTCSATTPPMRLLSCAYSATLGCTLSSHASSCGGSSAGAGGAAGGAGGAGGAVGMEAAAAGGGGALLLCAAACCASAMSSRRLVAASRRLSSVPRLPMPDVARAVLGILIAGWGGWGEGTTGARGAP
jgi:hypothetical protein